jgi:hypothetical protein
VSLDCRDESPAYLSRLARWFDPEFPFWESILAFGGGVLEFPVLPPAWEGYTAINSPPPK